jgi:catechol 2,3-dioxygenase-like lactoylglutathione lyase family enzyme
MTFIVADLERASLFFEKIFDAKEVEASGDKTFSLAREKFFLIADTWICIMEGQPLGESSYNHVAFKVNECDFDNFVLRVKESGVTIKPERPRVNGEGRSIYFYDFDNNLFELHTGTLEERLSRYSEGR